MTTMIGFYNMSNDMLCMQLVVVNDMSVLAFKEGCKSQNIYF